jgi:hypothetical protein
MIVEPFGEKGFVGSLPRSMFGSGFGASPSGKAPDFGSGIRRFESCRPSQLGNHQRLARFLSNCQGLRQAR